MEVLISIFILGIGVIGIAALFPAGIAQQRSSVDDVIGPIVADNAVALLRTRLEPGDFGTFEEFLAEVDWGEIPLRTVPGDWPWLRSGFLLEDGQAANRGSLDIFSYRLTRSRFGLPSQGSNISKLASELHAGLPVADPVLYGIPYNPSKYNFMDPIREPRVIVTQQERYYPMVSNEAVSSIRSPPLYVWDCMFRRYQGRVYVAIFVYRIAAQGGDRTNYATPPNPLTNPPPPPPAVPADLPPLPYRLALSGSTAWDAYGLAQNDSSDDALALGTPPGPPGAWDLRDPAATWQDYGQWLLDQNNTVHRVLSRTPQTADDAAVIELLRPVNPVSSFNAAVSYFGVPDTVGLEGVENVVTHLWYIPTEVDLDVDGDGDLEEGASVTLTPVYVTVREL
jgi:hypothetical protein